MAANRTASAGFRSSTATLTRSQAPAGRSFNAAGLKEPSTESPRGYVGGGRRVAPHVPHPRGGRLGSKQVVSVRGRRVTVTNETKKKFSAVTALALPLLIAGVAIAMILSGLSTNQSFVIQDLQSRERSVRNEVETLNRDVEELRSSAQLAQRATAAGMVVPGEPGILNVTDQGEVQEQRPAQPEAVSKIIDVNGTTPRSHRPSSDRDATQQIGRDLTAVPGGNVLGQDRVGSSRTANEDPSGRAANHQLRDNLAPYAPTVPAP